MHFKKRINLIRAIIVKNKIISVLMLTVGAIIFCSTSIFIMQKKSPPLNFILISSDTLRPDHMGIYGYSKNTTPNIDAWAKNALIFTNSHTTIPFTYPSFASLMTGYNPLSLKIYANRVSPPLSPNVQTIATILKGRGYTTAAFLTNGWLDDKYSGLKKGFDLFEINDYFLGNEDRQKLEKSISDAIDYLGKNKSKRLFVWIHILDPHAPYNPPNELRCKFNSKYCNVIRNTSNYDLGKERINAIACQKTPLQTDKKEVLETLYNGEIAYMDSLVGKILHKLKETGIDKKSLVMFYGDHGEGFDHNYYFTHGDVLYESATRIPVIIKDPRSSGKKINSLINNTDLFPTILSLLGISNQNQQTDGLNFKDKLYISPASLFAPQDRKFLYSVNIGVSKFSVFDGRYKYIFSLNKACLYNGQTEELYDLNIDPGETENIATNYIPLATQLKRQLFNYLSQYNLPQIVDEKKQIKNNGLLEKLKSYGY